MTEVISRKPSVLSLFAIGASLLAVTGASAERKEPLPATLEGVGVEDKTDAQVPLELVFADESGKSVALGEFFEPGRPVLLTLAYYECPMLCHLVLNGLVQALRDVPWSPGEEFEIVTVSIDPGETPPLARAKKANYLESYGKPQAAAGWHFLTGEAEAIERLADSVGFGFRYVEERDEYAHPAAIFVLTPEGRLSRYLSGVRPAARTLRLSMVEASQGQVGSALDQFILTCFHYDAEAGKYAPAALKLMRLGGAVTVVIVAVMLAVFWARESRRRRTAREGA